MITIILLTLLIVVMYLIYKKTEYTKWDTISFISGIMMAFLSIALIFYIVAAGEAYFQKDKLNRNYHILKNTLELSRQKTDYSTVERAAIINKVIEVNESITTHRRWVNNVFIGHFYSKEYANKQLLE